RHGQHVRSLWVEIPSAQASGLLSNPPPPPGHVEEEPEAHHDGQQYQQLESGKGRENHDRDYEGQRGEDHGNAHPPHVPHDSPVLLRRDLPGVPAAVARGALPPLSVGDVSDPSAVAADRYLGTAHVPHCRCWPAVRTGW